MVGVQSALDAIGSVHNVALAQLARTRRLVFTEGVYDAKVIRRFADILGHASLATGSGMTHVESDGFAAWERIRDFAWGLQKTLGATLKIAAIFDRDFYPEEQISSLLDALRQHIALAMVLERKEIENYLLVPDVLQRALERTIADATRRGQKPGKPIDVQATLLGIVDPFKAELQGVYLGKRWEHLRSCGRSIDTVNKETLEWFEDKWSNPSSRLKIVAGKTALAALRDQVKQHCRVSLTDARIFDAFRRDDVPPDLANLINALEAFRTASTTNAG